MEHRLSFQQIAAFLHLADAGSFRDAALALGVSQPALSRTIQQIEARLETRLFDRDTRRVQLTAAGQCLYPLLVRIRREYDDSFAEYEAFAAGASGVVRIASLPSLTTTLLPNAIASVLARHPGLRVEIREDVGLPVHRCVQERLADIGFAPPPPVSDGLAYRALLRDELMLVCRRDDPLASAGPQGWDVLARRRFVTTSQETGLRAMVDHALCEAGVQAEPVLACKQPATVAAMVKAGVGVGVLSRLTLADPEALQLATIPLQAPVVARSLGAVTSIGRSLAPAARLVLAEIESRARALDAPLERSSA